ncbi:MAG: response regulator [Magnetococcales bacterium]|nr:response regulator [Magnetococcales bacterium]
MNQWKISTRIFVGVFTLFMLLLLNGGVSVRNLVRLDDSFDRYAASTGEMLELVALERSLTGLRRSVMFALVSDNMHALRGSQDMLDQTKTRLATLLENDKTTGDNEGVLLRIGKIVRSLQSNLTLLAEFIDERDLLLRGKLLPVLRGVEDRLRDLQQRLWTTHETQTETQVDSAIEHLHQISALLARLTGVADETILPSLENETLILNNALIELGQHMSFEERTVAGLLPGAIREYLNVEQELAKVSRQIIQQDATDFTSLTGNQVANFTKLLQRLDSETSAQNHWTIGFMGSMALLACLISLAISRWLGTAIVHPLQAMTAIMGRLAAGDLSVTIPGQDKRDELGDMARALRVFHRAVQGMDQQRWLNETSVEFSRTMIQAETTQRFGQTFMERLVPLLQGAQGALFLLDEQQQRLQLSGGYALAPESEQKTVIGLHEGVIGQCAVEQRTIVLTGVPEAHVSVRTGLGRSAPLVLLVAPLVWKGRLQGVVEIAAFESLSERHHTLLEAILPMAALHLELLRRSLETQALLHRTQQQAEELKASQAVLRLQEEELIATNQQLRERGDLLESQTEELRTSEEELRVQGEELQLLNTTLAEKARMLEEREQSLIEARQVAEKRAVERELASRYKSEFLANMSHELRTPLNSLLILAESLADNETGNLTADQVESASIIHESGNHLLRLINDILDISKVEAGRMEAVIEVVNVAELVGTIERRFKRMAQSRGVSLQIMLTPAVVETIQTDRGKVEQILTNLLGNALKFTERGEVSLTVTPWENRGIALAVADTGVGIAEEKLERIFNAFEQADGTTSRRFGGTGLGLSIARKLARLLGGDIAVTSRMGTGSVFTLWLPDAATSDPSSAAGPVPTSTPTAELPPLSPIIPYPTDDRENIQEGNTVLLVVEDDPAFAGITYKQAKAKGFQCLLAREGEVALSLAQRFHPTGIILDVGLPGMDGWGVMNRLKQNPRTRSIPVHFVSAVDARLRALGMGAVGFLTKPVTQEQLTHLFDRVTQVARGSRQVLLVNLDPDTRQEVSSLLRQNGVTVEEVERSDDCLARLHEKSFQCLILDLTMAVGDGIDLLQSLVSEFGPSLPPVVIYSPRHLTSEELIRFREFTDSIIIRGGPSPDRLWEEVDQFLSQVQRVIPELKQPAGQLMGRKILVADDDMRNTFALSKLLRSKGMKVLMAQDGNKALTQLEANSDVDLVLMDIMMPEKDGYQTIREIRQRSCWQNLPIVVLTAKSMTGDQEQCLAAGANSYLTKPIDTAALLERIEALLTPGSGPDVP